MRTPDLFAAESPESAARELLRAEHADGAALSPAHQRFNQLLGQLSKARANLAEWQQARVQLGHAIQDRLMPAEQALAVAQHDFLRVLDALLVESPRGLKLTGRRRGRLEAVVLDLCAELLGKGGTADPEIIAIHDRYSGRSHEELEELREQEERLLMEMIANGLGLGEVLKGEETVSTEELGARLDAEFKARSASAQAAWAEDPAAQRAERNRQRAQERSEARRQVDLQASVRDIYRKLVRDLHPDREADPVERERKTALMQRINLAYEAGDLLTLLELQFQCEQLDPAKLAQLSAERLKHYTAVLREQLKTVREQARLELERVHAEWGLPESFRPRLPADLARWVDRQLDLQQQLARGFAQSGERLRNPHQLRAELDRLIATWTP